MKQPMFLSFTIGLAALVIALAALSASAQVPEHTTFTGRLVDDLGSPLSATVNLELRVFDTETGGSPFYSEEHLNLALDATGVFTIQLGLGTSPIGVFDATLFSETNRWLEVVVGGELLSPRWRTGSVPWALIAQQANAVVRDPNAPRFEDCGNGTIADHRTRLQWEKKTGSVTSSVDCETVGCPDPHDVNNTYDWSATGEVADGLAFVDFLGKLNDATFGSVDQGALYSDPTTSGCFAGHCDWRIPILDELGTIFVGPGAAPGQTLACSATPCIDPDLAVLDGPTANGVLYTSASTLSGLAVGALYIQSGSGHVFNSFKTSPSYVRAVRTGSCEF